VRLSCAFKPPLSPKTPCRSRPFFSGGALSGILGDDQEEAGEDEVADHRGAAVGDEGQRNAGERDGLRDAADDYEGLHGEHGRQAEGEELRGVVLGEEGYLYAPVREDEEDEEQGRRAQEPQLAGDGGEDEVRLHLGDGLGEARAETRAGDAAVGDVEDALGDLEPESSGSDQGSSQLLTRSCTWENARYVAKEPIVKRSAPMMT
jgi:hypothetical protein